MVAMVLGFHSIGVYTSDNLRDIINIFHFGYIPATPTPLHAVLSKTTILPSVVLHNFSRQCSLPFPHPVEQFRELAI